MLYTSTRDKSKHLDFSDIIKLGISPDGGLFVPENLPNLTYEDIQNMKDMNYQELSYTIFKKFIDDFTDKEIKDCVKNAYNEDKFDNEDIAPVNALNDRTFILELWHGPTCAFKDVALQILPHFIIKSVKHTNDKNHYVILVATSGDTGKAALEGFKDVKGTSIIVFYPLDGVSAMQKIQMITQRGNNVYVIGVKGNFDDAQAGVKKIFADNILNNMLSSNGIKLSSANSINWGRLVPQIVYYISSYLHLVKSNAIKGGEEINVAVPTGNFGNILAAFYAKKMGIPIHKLICASNSNNVLTDFIDTGLYNRNRDLIKTSSPSMDILISSNLERLLFEICDRDSSYISNLMTDLSRSGEYVIDKKAHEKLDHLFYGGYADENTTVESIRNTFIKYMYLVDPHTAVGLKVLSDYRRKSGDTRPALVASTASPYKFPDVILKALGLDISKYNIKDEFVKLNLLSEITGTQIPYNIKVLENASIRHIGKCNKTDMSKVIANILLK